VEQIDRSYGRLLPDSLDRARVALEAFAPRGRRGRAADRVRLAEQVAEELPWIGRSYLSSRHRFCSALASVWHRRARRLATY
jgi:hypothetical protein